MQDTHLFASLSVESPCGPDLEYDPAFVELEQCLAGAYTERAVGPERVADELDWKVLAHKAQALLTRTRDLRLVVILTKAWLHLDGLVGLARGLSVLQQLLALHWQSVHPQLGAQEDVDGLMRVHALRELCDAQSLLIPLRNAPLAAARALPVVSLADVERAARAAEGIQVQDAAASIDPSLIEAVFEACDPTRLFQTYDAAVSAREAVSALERTFVANSLSLLSLHELSAQLQLVVNQLQLRVQARRLHAQTCCGTSQSQAQFARRGDEADGVILMPDIVSDAAPEPEFHSTLSRPAVLRSLDIACKYYEEHEPASPVSMLLRRAQRLADMSFVELVRELAPSGLPEIELLRGPE